MKIDREFKELEEVMKKLGLKPKDYDYTSDAELEEIVNMQEIKQQEEVKKELYKGIEIVGKDLKEHLEIQGGLLTCKGEQVVVYIKDNTRKEIDDINNNPNAGNRFHIGWCRTLEEMDNRKRFDRYIVTKRDDGKFEIDTAEGKEYVSKLNVCKNCLNHLEYKGYSQEDYSYQQKTQAVEEFNIKEFLNEHEGILRYLKIPERRAETTPVDIRGPEYTIIANKLKNEKNYTCEECAVNLKLKKNRSYLHAYHINGRKYDNSRQNLKILCISCHIGGYHSDTRWVKIHAKDIQACREIKKQQDAGNY